MGSFNTIQESGGGGGGWEQGVNQVTLTTSGDLVGIGVAPTEKLHVDGAVALKTQAPTPSAAADYAKIFSADTGLATDTNIKLLLHGDGTDGSTSIIDSSPAGRSPSVTGGTTQIDTAYKKFRSGAIWFDGNSDYLDYADHADWDLPGEFAIHFWVRFDDVVGYYPIFTSTTDVDPLMLRVHWDGRSGASSPAWYVMDGSAKAYFADTLTNDTWHHFAITRDDSNQVNLYGDGTRVGTYSSTVSYTSGGLRLNKGHTGGTDYWEGHLDEFTWIKGSYNGWNGSTITVPTAPTAGSGSTSLFVLDEDGNETKISPHNPETGAWEYYSKNQKTGRVVRVDMEEVVSDLGKLTGKDYIKHE